MSASTCSMKNPGNIDPAHERDVAQVLGIVDEPGQRVLTGAGFPLMRGCSPTDIIRPTSSPSSRNRSRHAVAVSKKCSGLP